MKKFILLFVFWAFAQCGYSQLKEWNYSNLKIEPPFSIIFDTLKNTDAVITKTVKCWNTSTDKTITIDFKFDRNISRDESNKNKFIEINAIPAKLLPGQEGKIEVKIIPNQTSEDDWLWSSYSPWVLINGEKAKMRLSVRTFIIYDISQVNFNSSPKISFDKPKSFIVGEVEKGKNPYIPYYITNKGNADLKIFKIRPKNGLINYHISRKTIPPGETDFLYLEYNAKHSESSNNVQLLTNDPINSIVTIKLEGINVQEKVENLNKSTYLFDINEEDKMYLNAIQNEGNDIQKYLSAYPSGKYYSSLKKYNEELAAYEKCKNGSMNELNNYITKYPNGKFINEVKNMKTEQIRIAERNKQIEINSNKSLWYLGDKVCYIDFNGIVVVSIDQWNENKSRFKGIVVASPGGLYEGEVLQKGNALWIDPKGWHKCLDDELEYALRNDKSLEAEQLLKNKNKKFDTGTKVCFTGKQSAILFSYSVTIEGMVEEWNSDFTKMKVKITYDAGGTYYNGQNVYNGATIWVSPIGWKKCN